ncbi:hypothetical protein HOJ01_01405 [bacterium]|nr:hypothetical protein [bacterium]MBT6293445.1 hypothetical protein [bacterium]
MHKKITINWERLRETINQPVEQKPEHKEAVERITAIALKRLEQREAMKNSFAAQVEKWTSIADSDSAVTTVNVDWSNLRTSIAQKIERKDEHTVVVERLTQIAQEQLRFREAMKNSFTAQMEKWTSIADSDSDTEK